MAMVVAAHDASAARISQPGVGAAPPPPTAVGFGNRRRLRSGPYSGGSAWMSASKGDGVRASSVTPNASIATWSVPAAMVSLRFTSASTSTAIVPSWQLRHAPETLAATVAALVTTSVVELV